MKHTTRTVKWVVTLDDGLCGDGLTEIEIMDEVGEFVEVTQHDDGCGRIHINPEEWPSIRAAIDSAIKQCKHIK